MAEEVGTHKPLILITKNYSKELFKMIISSDVSNLSHKYSTDSLGTNLTTSSFTTKKTLGGQIQKLLLPPTIFIREKCMVILM
jgi:hypothetical protein